MAAFTAIDDAGANYNTIIWAGDNTTPRALTGVGFQSDYSWLKDRTATHNHTLWNSLTGAGGDKELTANEAYAEGGGGTATYGYLSPFAADGFSVVTGTLNNSRVNETGDNYVAWNWKMGTTTGIDTTGSTITPDSYSFNADAGQSIIKYGGNGVAGALLPHGLGAVPGVFMVKCLTTAEGWRVFHHKLDSSAPEDYYLVLNENGTAANGTVFNDTMPTSVNLTLGSNDNINNATKDYMAYVFTPIPGYSKMGNYTGTANANGAFIYTGFRPAYILIKSAGVTNDWIVVDSKRLGYNVDNNPLFPNGNGAISDVNIVDIVSNGFKLRHAGTDVNATSNMVYLAFAESPFVNSNGVPTNAR